jgi:hypothetical protein
MSLRIRSERVHPTILTRHQSCVCVNLVKVADNDEDGEHGAGAKLAQLLVSMEVWLGPVLLSPCFSLHTHFSVFFHAHIHIHIQLIFNKHASFSLSTPNPESPLSLQTSFQTLFSVSQAIDVMVVVSRWYGGIHLGPDRFRIINSAARALLSEAGGFGADQSRTQSKKSSKKR